MPPPRRWSGGVSARMSCSKSVTPRVPGSGNCLPGTWSCWPSFCCAKSRPSAARMGRFERYLDDPPAGLHPEPVVLLFGGCSAIVVLTLRPELAWDAAGSEHQLRRRSCRLPTRFGYFFASGLTEEEGEVSPPSAARSCRARFRVLRLRTTVFSKDALADVSL